MEKQFHKKYTRTIITIYTLILLFRLFETFLIFYNYGYENKVLFSEFLGFCYDILGASIFIIGYFLFCFSLFKTKMRVVRVLNLSLLFVLTIISFVVIKYFLYQLIPLDIFLYKYSFQEIFFTISTSSINLFLTAVCLILILSLVAFSAWIVSKVNFKPIAIKLVYCFLLFSFFLFFLSNYLGWNKLDKFSINKPFYFISKSIKYLSNNNDTKSSNVIEFKKLYPEKDFLSKEYPLVHKIERENELGNFFHKFESNPNIVILIIEGLNDDFIHEYKGSLLMPFLSQLKNKSLYWKRCFTLGERSFAVVPSILGGLPYGDKGFTLQERLPRHLSLVSVLNSNDYYTSFYYGQGAWFHKKDRFFKYNDIDLIFDNSKFSDNYDKIVVGNDNFFWGYNDKDLFNQSLRVIDTLNQNKRLDIYYTGTSHSPYVICDEDFYSGKLKELTTEPHRDFYQTYSKYLKSVLFVDDALKEFFNKYKKRQDYENTIFIITGDHPMTEVPIANSLKRYHVPLLIFSEKLKGSHSFSEIVSHLDVSESILSFLQDYLKYIPSNSTSLGDQLLNNDKILPKNIAFMNDNREVIDFLYGDYYLAEDKLYFVDSLLSIVKIENDSIKSILTKKLNDFNNTSLFVTRNNKIISSKLYCKELNHLDIYDYLQKDSIHTSSEYINLTDNILTPNSDFIFDISLDITTKNEGDISVVYQISNSKDSILLWRSIGVNEDKITQAHIPIDKAQVDDTEMYFKSYIWNKNKIDLTISDIDILLHSPILNSHSNVNTK